MGVGGTKETSNPTLCSAFRGLPHWGERAGKKKREGKKERERAAQRGSENENNIPAPPDFFTL